MFINTSGSATAPGLAAAGVFRKILEALPCDPVLHHLPPALVDKLDPERVQVARLEVRGDEAALRRVLRGLEPEAACEQPLDARLDVRLPDADVVDPLAVPAPVEPVLGHLDQLVV